MTALHMTALNGHLDLYTYLLSKGCDTKIRNIDGSCAYHFATSRIDGKKYEELHVKYGGQLFDAPHFPSMPTLPPSPFALSPNDEKPPQSDTENVQSSVDTTQKSNVTIPLVTGNGDVMILCPGQGTQKVGMANQYLDTPSVKALFEEANTILGYDILSLVKNGPLEKLNDTLVSQPAIYLTTLASYLHVYATDPSTVENAGHVAGFSLGEYTAHVLGGVLDWRDHYYLLRNVLRQCEVPQMRLNLVCFLLLVLRMMTLKKYVKNLIQL